MRSQMPTRSVNTYKTLIAGILIITIVFSGHLSAQETPTKKTKRQPQLCVGDYQSEQAAVEQLAGFAQSYSNLDEWKTRAGRIRDGILRGAELLPLPKKGKLNPIIHSKRVYKGYTVENAAFESSPRNFCYRKFVSSSRPQGTFCRRAVPPRPLGPAQ